MRSVNIFSPIGKKSVAPVEASIQRVKTDTQCSENYQGPKPVIELRSLPLLYLKVILAYRHEAAIYHLRGKTYKAKKGRRKVPLLLT